MLYEFGLKIHAPVGGVFGVKVGQTEAFFSNFQSPVGYGHDPIHTQKIRSEGQFDKLNIHVEWKQTDGRTDMTETLSFPLTLTRCSSAACSRTA